MFDIYRLVHDDLYIKTHIQFRLQLLELVLDRLASRHRVGTTLFHNVDPNCAALVDTGDLGIVLVSVNDSGDVPEQNGITAAGSHRYFFDIIKAFELLQRTNVILARAIIHLTAGRIEILRHQDLVDLTQGQSVIL